MLYPRIVRKICIYKSTCCIRVVLYILRKLLHTRCVYMYVGSAVAYCRASAWLESLLFNETIGTRALTCTSVQGHYAQTVTQNFTISYPSFS